MLTFDLSVITVNLNGPSAGKNGMLHKAAGWLQYFADICISIFFLLVIIGRDIYSSSFCKTRWPAGGGSGEHYRQQSFRILLSIPSNKYISRAWYRRGSSSHISYILPGSPWTDTDSFDPLALEREVFQGNSMIGLFDVQVHRCVNFEEL